MIVHFAANTKILCNRAVSRNKGALFSKYNDYARYRQFHVDAEFLYTTSDEQVTCPFCISARVSFHESMIAKLKRKLPPETAA